MIFNLPIPSQEARHSNHSEWIDGSFKRSLGKSLQGSHLNPLILSSGISPPAASELFPNPIPLSYVHPAFDMELNAASLQLPLGTCHPFPKPSLHQVDYFQGFQIVVLPPSCLPLPPTRSVDSLV